MRKINKSLVATALIASLTGCGEDSFTPESNSAENAPEHGGDIVVTVNEKDPLRYVYFLGTPTGDNNGPGQAIDRDGDLLTIKNLTSDTDDMTGVEVSGLSIALRPTAIADSLDTGQTRTVVMTYDVSDGVTDVPRTATVNIIGEDFAPVIEGDLFGDFLKSDTPVIDLLFRVTDADGEPLTASNVVASPDNISELPFTLENNMLTFDLASVQDDIPDSVLTTYNFTYTVSDHNNDLTRNLSVRILGVADVPGAPVFTNYFLSDALDETAGVQTYDLLVDVSDREGDDIQIKNVMLNGSPDMMHGASIEGSTLTFKPNAFLPMIEAGAFQDFVFTYQVEDVNGNTSDGVRSMSITVTGVESNILVQNGVTEDFEGLAAGDLPEQNAGWRSFTVDGSPLPVVSTDAARTGDYGIFLEQGSGIEASWPAEIDRIYYYSSWFRKTAQETSGFVHFNAYGNTRAWWQGGLRQWVPDSTQWNEAVSIFTTFSFGLPIVDQNPENQALIQALNGPLCCTSSEAHIDDFRIVDITEIAPYANNMLVDGAGGFEDGVVPANNGDGSFTVTTTPTEVTNGTTALVVDTTGKAGYSSAVLLPVQTGAIMEGGRYMLQLDIHATNAPAAAATGFEVRVETASGSVHNFASTWSNVPNPGVRVMLNTERQTGTPDWANEPVNVRLMFTATDIVYHVDNVTLFAVP